ncbi:hypothetical protein LXL04_033450 [Taraxacum kok-saghyz]
MSLKIGKLHCSTIDATAMRLSDSSDGRRRRATSLKPRLAADHHRLQSITFLKVELYREEFPTEHELGVLEVELRNYIKDVQEDEIFDHLKSILYLAKKMVEVKKHIIFPKVYLLLKLALILPVATASVERAFSAMKLIKTDIRNKMGDKFLSDSLVSYIENDVLDSFDNDTIIARFQAIRPRRIQLNGKILRETKLANLCVVCIFEVKTSAVCGPHLQPSAAEEVDQTSTVCKKKTGRQLTAKGSSRAGPKGSSSTGDDHSERRKKSSKGDKYSVTHPVTDFTMTTNKFKSAFAKAIFVRSSFATSTKIISQQMEAVIVGGMQ